MPKIKVEKVVSFSTEDPAFPASNILDPDPSKKWKTQSPGEKSANIVLQLEQATQIISIDIGNDNSAYIEVLVSRSSSNEDYKVLLVMSSFMSPIESRQSTNTNKVRMFTYDQLSSPERDEKWDRIKIVCTQPFNRHVQYGLAFISFTSNEIKPDLIKPQIGKFLVRSESPTNFSAGSLFARRKEEVEDKKSLSVDIRKASLSPKANLNCNKLKVTQSLDKESTRNRDELLYNDDEKEGNVKIDALIAKRDQEKKEREAREFIEKLEKEAKMRKLKEEKEKEKEKNKKIDTPIKVKIDKDKRDENNGEGSSKKENNKRKLDVKEKTKKIKIKKPSLPFQELLKGVVFVISGIQNPERGNLRSMALAMGAKYKPDWENSCTHLVCAFANTPKFNQVRDKGKIVTRDWISDCYAQRKRLPWRRYALDRRDQNKPESEEEIGEGNDDETNVSGSDTDIELESAQKKFKRNGVIVDSPCGTPSPTIDLSGGVEENSNDGEKSPEIVNITNPSLSIYDCETEEEEDFSLKTTKLPTD